MKKIIYTILFLLIINPVFADIFDNPHKLSEIKDKMPKMGSIKCSFRQEKTMQNIQKPLVSTGDFEFIEGKGVYFYTKYPIQSTADYTSEKYKQINDMVAAISTKRYSKLEKEFDFYYEGNIKNWTLGLKPKKNSDASPYILSMVIVGSDYINKININQTNGNKTTIWFKK